MVSTTVVERSRSTTQANVSLVVMPITTFDQNVDHEVQGSNPDQNTKRFLSFRFEQYMSSTPLSPKWRGERV